MTDQEIRIDAASTFFRLAKDYQDTPENYAAMNCILEEFGWSGARVNHLLKSWAILKQRAPQSVPHSVQNEDTALNAAAYALINSGRVSQASIAAMSAEEYQRACMDLAFVRADEILNPRPANVVPLTRGDHIQAARTLRTAEVRDEDLAEAARAVQASRDAHAQAFANYQAPKAGPEGGIYSGFGFCTACSRGLNCTAHPARATRPHMTKAEAERNEAARKRDMPSRGDAVRAAGKARREEISKR